MSHLIPRGGFKMLTKTRPFDLEAHRKQIPDGMKAVHPLIKKAAPKAAKKGPTKKAAQK